MANLTITFTSRDEEPWDASGEEYTLPFPWGRARREHPVLPVFLPFAGCASRCVFCAQDAVSGAPARADANEAVLSALEELDRQLAERAARRAAPAEVAFYGGSFTALPEQLQAACLRRLAPWRERGMVCAARCSTRPDAVTADGLAYLKDLGLGTVELGVQSFHGPALRASGRAYGEEYAPAACALVKRAGLRLGVQLMPGMPGSDGGDGSETGPAVSMRLFLDDLRRALRLGADFLRSYPCLVIEGTELARLWRAGRYRPWPLALAVEALAEGLLAAGAAGVPVIRMGLPLEKEFVPRILAGPAHPALGALAQAEALFRFLAPLVTGRTARALHLPARCRGFFWGERGSMRPRWAALGLRSDNVFFETDSGSGA